MSRLSVSYRNKTSQIRNSQVLEFWPVDKPGRLITAAIQLGLDTTLDG